MKGWTYDEAESLSLEVRDVLIEIINETAQVVEED